MAGKKYSSEQIIGYLREAEVPQAKGSTIPQICKKQETHPHHETRLLITILNPNAIYDDKEHQSNTYNSIHIKKCHVNFREVIRAN